MIPFRIIALCLLVLVSSLYASAVFTVRIPVRDKITKTPVMSMGSLYDENMKCISQNQFREPDGTLIFLFPQRPPKYTLMIAPDANDGNGMKHHDYDSYFSDFEVPADSPNPFDYPVVYLERHREATLEEVTVTQTLVKFYHKGDTLVYNANAFVLSEGSMLDALITQLPGVELNRNGEIFCNNKKINSLLLNGRDIFNGNKVLMLENLAAYTVKSIEVYDKAGRTSHLMGQDAGDNTHVMDVKLKKQYSSGWLVNAEGGYGTADKYLARLFASWFSDYVSVSAIGNVNNLSDFTSPSGRSGPWRNSLSSGVGSNRLGGLTYNAVGRDSKWEIKGDVTVKSNSTDVSSAINSESVSEGLDVYGYCWVDTTSHSLLLKTSHEFFTQIGSRANVTVAPSFSYSTSHMEGDVASGTFLSKMTSPSRRKLMEIYSQAGSTIADSMISRTVNDLASRTNGIDASVKLQSDIKLVSTGQRNMLSLKAEALYNGREQDRFDRYRINYGNNPEPQVYRHRYFDNRPNRSGFLKASAKFTQFLDYHMIKLPLEYEFTYRRKKIASNVYLLPLGISGIDELPPAAEYLDAIDHDMSYDESETERTHTISFRPIHSLGFKLGGITSYSLSIMPSVEISFSDRNYSFIKYNAPTHIRRTDILTNGYLAFHFMKRLQNEWIYDVSFDYKTNPVNMSYLVDVPSENPMIIFKGNPDLKNRTMYSGKLRASYESSEHLKHGIVLDGAYYYNDVQSAMNWDLHTGVQTYTWQNSKSNWDCSAFYSFYMPFGPKKQFNIESTTKSSYSQIMLSDIKCHNLMAGETLKLNWQPGKHRVGIFGAAGFNRYTFSESQNQGKLLDDFSAWTCRYGAEAVVKLPQNWSISTDLTLYTRRGFSDPRLNTTDLVWNTRLTKSILKGSLVFVVDGYDLLHQLSNVTYTVNAQSRTEVVSNVIPSYVLFHLQWRFNKQPRK